MAVDPNKPLLRLAVSDPSTRIKGAPRSVPKPPFYSRAGQAANFGPRFRQLGAALDRDITGLALKRDPAALAPERLLVFELRGSIGTFVNAVRKVSGLELIDEEELEADDRDSAPTIYLMVPNGTALRQIVSLWEIWRSGEKLPRGFTPWRDVFATLRDIRPWNATDRLVDEERDILAAEVAALPDEAPVRLEVELVFRQSTEISVESERVSQQAIAAAGGTVVSRCRIPEISYHSLLAELPAKEIRQIIERSAATIAGLEPVMHIRPQSTASTIDATDPIETEPSPTGIAIEQTPILALIDGVPVAQHPLLAGTIVLDDQFGLVPQTQVADRVHGTAMASLILRGDRNLNEQAIARRIHCVPVLGPRDRFPNDRLIVDLVYQAVLAMRQGDEPTAPDVIIVNLSLGNPRKPFYTRLSAWARLLDRLSHQFGILFIVSAGNYDGVFAIPAYASMRDLEDADPLDRAKATIAALGQIIARRKLFSPSESVNGLTIGAANSDFVSDADRRMARANVDPFSEMAMSNASSALGPGFAGSVKPDVLFPGAKERLAMSASGAGLSVRPTSGMRPHGLKVAAPPRAGSDSWEHYTSGTSAAAALASRLSHQVHDGLEAAYGQAFLSLPSAQRAALLKALVVHTATWPETTADLIKSVIGPLDGKRHVEQRDNIRRFIGYGFSNPDAAISCANDRATFWAVGHLMRDQAVSVDVPIPACVNGRALPHSMSATLAWFTPILSNRQSYRAVRLSLGEPSNLPLLRLDYAKSQPDQNQTRRGTIISRRWEGARAPAVTQNQMSSIIVQRENDIGSPVDESVPFGLAMTFSMPGAVEIYDEVLARVAVRPRIPAPP
jgi:hypothetical protein